MLTATLALASLALALPDDSGFDSLFPLDGLAFDNFGSRIAVDGDWMVVASIGDQTPDVTTGSVYVLRRDPGGWVFDTKLLPDPLQQFQNFGFSLDIEGTRIVVGAPTENAARENQGAVYYYERSAGQWSLVQRLVSSDEREEAKFGFHVSLSGDRLAVSSPGFRQDVPGLHLGQVDVHELRGGIWRSSAVIESFEGEASWDANEIALDGDTLLSTIRSWNQAAGEHQSVRVHERTATGWQQTQTLEAPVVEGAISVSFGYRMKLRGERLLVADPFRRIGDAPRAGSVFSYQREQGSWILLDILEPPTPWSDTYFGGGLDFGGTRAVVGTLPLNSASPGEAEVYVYREKGLRYGLERRLVSRNPVEPRSFGESVGLSGDDVLGSVTSADPNGVRSGAVYRYDVPEVYSSFCAATATSQGEPARLFFEGPACVDSVGQVFVARPVPNDYGVIFSGTQMIDVPFGNGRRCVAGQVVRMSLTVAENGELVVPLDAASLGIGAGETRLFQAWFRDATAPPAGFNLSDGVSITFE